MYKKSISLSVILPAYQEADNLSILLPKLKDELNSLSINYEIIIVDSLHKLDRTEEVCRQYDCTYYNRTQSNNYASAVKTGIANIKGEYVIFMDADGSHDPCFVKKLYNARIDADIVIASRYVKGGGSENNLILKFMSYILNFTYFLVLGLKLKDISNSFRLYKSEFLKNLQLECDNFDVIQEILIKVYSNNKFCKIKEIPFFFKNRNYGKTKRNLFMFVFSYIVTLIKLKSLVNNEKK